MAKATPIIAAFNAGEWSPLLDGRVDLAGYSASCVSIENGIPTIQGPLIRRGGTRYIAEVEDSANRSWLVPFVRSRSVAYVVEFADSVCRFYRNRAVVGAPFELVSPYNAAALVLPNGEFALDFVQSADVLYITDRRGVLAPRKLSRTSATTFAFSTLDPDDGPFDDLNASTTTIYSSAATGTVTLTASASVFTADDIGSIIRLDQQRLATPLWVTGTSYTAGDYVRSEGKEYVAATTATSGTQIPSHTNGTVSDGGVEWTYTAVSYGVARITAQAGTTATATVLTRFPQSLVGSSNATLLWKRGAWSELNGYPTSVTFFRERLVFAKEQRLDMSVVADFENFGPDELGEITAESAISVSVQSSQVNDIVALVEGDTLGVHTEGGEFSVSSLTTSEPFGPGNVEVSLSSSYGSRPIRPVRVGEATLYVQASGRKLRELVFDIQVNNQISRDMSVRSEHITRPLLVQLVRQESPWEVVWALRSDGVILAFTYDRTQEVRAWSRCIIGGAAVVESLAVIPSDDGARDDVWMICRRTVDGGTVRYIEVMEPDLSPSGDVEDSFYVDSGVTYDGAATDTITGLDHLEGETLKVLADGATHPDVVVTGGEVTLARDASVVHVGYSAPFVVGTNRIEAGAADGTSQSKTKRITDVAFRVYRTLGGSAGPLETQLDDIPALTYRAAATLMGSGPDLFSGDATIDWPGGYETAGRIWYVNDEPYPVTMVAAIPQVMTQENR